MENKISDIIRYSFICDPTMDGKRLDAALVMLFPDFGLRARRRLWEWCKVTVDGKSAKPGQEVKAGNHIELECVKEEEEETLPDFGLHGLELVAVTRDYCAVYKPDGLPSAAIAGNPCKSAESLVASGWDKLAAGFEQPISDVSPILCNRLDTATSGLLLFAFSRQAVDDFRNKEKSGKVDKRYYALVPGRAPRLLVLEKTLDMADRAKTRALDSPDPDPNRHTCASLLHVYADGPVHDYFGYTASLLHVSIKRGARHQIRVHLADAGFPIVGDSLYGDPKVAAKERYMYLHHGNISFDGFSASLRPKWDLWPLLK